MGLLDFIKTPEGQGLLSAAFGGLAGARRGQPLNSLGRAGLAGLTGFGAAQDRIGEAETRAQNNEMRSLQVDAFKQSQATAQRLQDQAQVDRLAATRAFTTRTPIQALSGGGGPTLANAETIGQQQAFDPRRFMTENPGVSMDAVKQVMEIDKTMNPRGEAFTLSEGGSRFDANGKLIAQSQPKAPAQPAAVLEYQFAQNQGFKGSFQEFNTSQKRAGATNIGLPSMNVNMGSQESEQSKVYGKGIGEQRVAIQNAGFAAPGKIAQIDRMEELLKGVGGGALAGTGMQIASIASSLGLQIDPKLGRKEASEALSIEMALSMRTPGSGPMTDKDFDNFAKTVPGLSKTPEGRAQISKTLRAKAARDMQVAEMSNAYAAQNNGVIDDRFFNQVSQFIASNPVTPGRTKSGNASGATDGVFNPKTGKVEMNK